MCWLEFIISSTIIVLAGIRLTVYSDKLSDRLSIGKLWIGVALLGLVTSLPEAITSLTSVIQLGANNLAVGNILGSNTFNPMLVVVMDIVYRKGSITNDIPQSKQQEASAYFAIILTLIVVVEIFLCKLLSADCPDPICVGNILIAIVYFLSMRYLALNVDKTNIIGGNVLIKNKNLSLSNIWMNIIISSLFIIGAAIWLANSADAIAQETGLGRTFVGSIFLAIVTSLPEMVVTVSALKMGLFNMALGNIFGSNMANVFILFLCSLFNKGNSILSTVSSTHILTGLLSITLVSIIVIGVRIKNKKTFMGLGIDSIIMIVLFLTGTGVLYKFR